MIVVKLGGTNGSGKTSVARALLDMMEEQDVAKKATYGFIDGKAWVILGSYKTVCGGMDTISDKEERLALINDHIGNGWRDHDEDDVIFFEGLITGKTYGKIGELSELDNGARWIYAFMDTPFEVCVERVLARRAARGNTAPFNAERTMRPTYKAVHSTAKRALAQGHKVVWLPHKLKPAHIAEFLINEVKEFAREGR